MPASRMMLAVTILLAAFGIPIGSLGHLPVIAQTFPTDSPTNQQLSKALLWLVNHQQADGSYGSYLDGQTAVAGYALWLNDSASTNAIQAYSYLVRQLNDSNSWFWGSYGEADVPGELLYSVAVSQHLSQLQNLTRDSSNLLFFQQQNGGFQGYYDPTGGRSVTSSVDTALGLLGLINAETISLTNRTDAVHYLLSLQNADGSFNLTRTVQSDSIYSFGPDPASITALVTLALRDASVTMNASPVSRALGFLSRTSMGGLNGPGHVYAASLSTLSFIAFRMPRDASNDLAYVLSQQNSDGGFRDVNRSSSGSNALDTGMAAVALQLGMVGPSPPPMITDHPPAAEFSFNPQNPALNTAVNFNGMNSYDPDGDPLIFSWAFGDGGLATGITVSHVYDRTGNFTVTLKVTEMKANPPQLSGTTWITITVQSPEIPKAPTAPPSTGVELAFVAVAAAALVAAYLVLGRRRKPV